jgi:hypothetical protein
MKICSKSFKEGYWEEFVAQLRKMEYGDQGISMNFITYIMKAGIPFYNAGAEPLQEINST